MVLLLQRCYKNSGLVRKKEKKKHQANTVIARFLIFNIDEVESVT